MRKFLILSLAFIMLLCLVACSTISEEESSEEPTILESIIDVPEESIEGVVTEEEKEESSIDEEKINDEIETPTIVEKTTVEIIGLLKEGPNGDLLTYGSSNIKVNSTNILVINRNGKLKNAEAALNDKEPFYGFLTDLTMGDTNVYIVLEVDSESYTVFAALLYEAANNQNEIMNYDYLFIINSWLELPLYGYEDRTDSAALRASAFNLALREGRISEAQYLIEQIYYSLMEKTSN